MIVTDFSEEVFDRALARAREGDLQAASVDIRNACLLAPDLADNWKLCATLALIRSEPAMAVSALSRAGKIQLNDVKQELSLAEAYRRSGRIQEALERLRAFTLRHPDDERGWANLGFTCQHAWRELEASRAFRRVACLQPERIEFACKSYVALPAVPKSNRDIGLWRARFTEGISRIGRLPPDQNLSPDVFGAATFYLAYHNSVDRDIVERFRKSARKLVPFLNEKYDHKITTDNLTDDRGIVVGFISEFLFDHTIGKLYRGIIKNISRDAFEIVVIHMPGSRPDRFRSDLDSLADRAVEAPADRSAQCELIASLKLDILFYPEIGMSSSTYFLAYTRLAPVQAVAWGHPNTTGIDTVDYFLSSSCLEPENADDYYTERLIRFSRLPSCYEPPAQPSVVSGRSHWGLPETGVLYGCPQSLFKLHPEFDAILAEIVRLDPSGHLVFLAGSNELQTDAIKARWRSRHPDLLERSIFLPRQGFGRFLELIARLDVLLDPIHFGSGNTMYEAMIFGTPIVSWPGRFMRARIVAAAYRQMEIADAPLVERLEDYAATAVAWGRDPERRDRLRRVSKAAAREKLFNDTHVVREFEEFFLGAVQARRDNELLPKGWAPSSVA